MTPEDLAISSSDRSFGSPVMDAWQPDHLLAQIGSQPASPPSTSEPALPPDQRWKATAAVSQQVRALMHQGPEVAADQLRVYRLNQESISQRFAPDLGRLREA